MSTQGGYGQGPGEYGQGPQGYGQAPQGYGPGGHPPEEEQKKPNMAVFWSVAVVVAIALGVGGYFFGQSQGRADYDPGTADYQAIYDTGFSAGKNSGEASGKAAGQAAGEESGKKAGVEEGTKAGIEQGQAQGTQQGALAALGGFSSWDTGDTFYVVQMEAGKQPEVPYVVASRTAMTSNFDYSPCENDPGTLCTFPRATSGGASAQAGDDTGTSTGTDTTGGATAP